MECYTILGSEGRTETTEKREERIGEDAARKREKERKKEKKRERESGREVEGGEGDGVDGGKARGEGRRRE